MNLEERQKELDKLRHKHPELKKALKWYRICEAFSFCQSEGFDESSDNTVKNHEKRNPIRTGTRYLLCKYDTKKNNSHN